ncbi:integrase core domain-containing protein, partial [Corynebacterium striatum]|uniref:integrase core domain-containing protein n=1 Tax=Corynebacterium striatum TaxID=43770 RepID=UPI003B59B688
MFGVPRHGGRLPFFPTQPGWISGVYQTGVRSHAQGPWTSVGEVELATLRWVHWWNTKRLHEALDYATPQEVET